jgi:H+/Cl- antiporter ClcA
MTLSGFLARWVGALILVLGTYNPTPYCFLRWIAALPADQLPSKVLVGLLILIGFVIYIRATWEALGPLGVFLAIVLTTVVIWWLRSEGLLNTDPRQPALVWVILIAFATILAVGMSWAFWRRKIAGQVESV